MISTIKKPMARALSALQQSLGGTLRRTALAAGVGCALLFSGAVITTPAAPAFAGHKEDGALDDYAHFLHLEIERIRYKWVASWMKMTQHFSANMMQQMMIIGSFLDAKHHMESFRLFQQLTNEAHRNYHPSDQMCRFGTNVRSLAAVDEKSRANAQIMATILLTRESLSGFTSASGGSGSDKRARLRQFKKTYCDIHDNNDRLKEMCRLSDNHDGETFQRGAPDKRTNKDINYNANIDGRYTLDIDFMDSELTEDEEDVLALAKNLFAHDIFDLMQQDILALEKYPELLTDIRSITTIRGIARNSFGHVVGQRSAGTEVVAPFIKLIVREMGAPEDEMDQFLGKNPSYFAQMEVLTRKMYQNPSFYANLYTKPANIERTAAAMQAIGLMQDRDRFEAALRREMLISSLLELKLRTEQGIADNAGLNYGSFDISN